MAKVVKTNIDHAWRCASKFVDLVRLCERYNNTSCSELLEAELSKIALQIETSISRIEDQQLQDYETWNVLSVFDDIKWIYEKVASEKMTAEDCSRLFGDRAYEKRFKGTWLEGTLFENRNYDYLSKLTEGQRKFLSISAGEIHELEGPVMASYKNAGRLLGLKLKQMENVVKGKQRKSRSPILLRLSSNRLDEIRDRFLNEKMEPADV